MKTNFFSVIIVCFMVTTVFSQSNLNDYKYVIVPNKFDFLKQKDQYQLNSLAQFLFKKYGFEALMEGGKYPEDLIRNRCLALRSDVVKESGMFKTKLSIELKDCNDQLIYSSKLGESREKDYSRAYNEALRNTFKSIEALNYKYKPNENITGLQTQSSEARNEVTQEIEQLKQEIQNLKKEKEAEVAVNAQKVVESKPKVEVVPVPTIKKEVNNMETGVKEVLSKVLYAQEIENGFQLVDSSPKVVYRIKQTKLDNIFLVENTSAIIYKKEDRWVIEYYSNNVLKQEELNIKF
ncbi:hypothetical protein Q4Q34_11400 [Flavivirga abyssicola]|uniref:hypothetical protein n=1 Tax=Flavivirga abyssicola TaxID=3063533 RepID=UPI0026DF7E6C|nr:hypothetical protein [Flavivirga sp. MEBiC07777]WVK11830.1 hypothetical protein Q4Q34_11400 [Flavivirga sp. MEBiC07777]